MFEQPELNVAPEDEDADVEANIAETEVTAALSNLRGVVMDLRTKPTEIIESRLNRVIAQLEKAQSQLREE